MAEPFKGFFQEADDYDFSVGATPDDDYDYSSAPRQAATPAGVVETFQRGFDAGLQGIATDKEYFKGLFNTLTGDEEAAATNIRNARAREEQNSQQFGALQDFGEFIDNPTFGGFLNQVAKNVGQVTPYLFTTVGSGLGGAAVTTIGKAGLNATNRHVTKRIVQDAMKKKLAGEATPDEERLLAVSYRLAQRNGLGKAANKLSAGGGMRAGMFGQEYVSMGGSNFGENIDVEGVSDEEAALRAAGLAIPQALVGLKGEEMLRKMLFQDLSSIAAKRSTKEGSTFANYAKDILKNTARGGATESAAETLQEGMQIANRFNIDDEYTKQEALLRIGEGAFAGFFGGAGISAAGSTAVTGLRASGDVMSKAKDFIEQARQKQVDDQLDKEQYGTDSMGYTTPEPRASVNAQIRSMLDDSTERDSVWIAGAQPVYNASDKETNQVEIEGKTFYTRFIPGRGTILTRHYDVAEEVANSEASDSSLAEALGYSTTKPADASIVIEVLDRGGNVVWQEAANESTVDGAYAAANKQVPEGGSVRRISIEEALENRRRAFNEEQGPQVRNIDIPDNVREAFMDQDVDENTAFTEDEGTTDEQIMTERMGEINPIEFKNIGGKESYKRSDGKVYEETESLRNAFAEAFFDEFGEINWDSPAFSGMSSALLRQATKAKVDNPDTDVFVQANKDGTYSIMQGIPPDQDVYYDSRESRTVEDAGKTESLSQKVLSALRKAARSNYAKNKKTKGGWATKDESELVTVNDTPVNLADLVSDGQRMVSVEEKADFEEGGPLTAKRNGLFRILGELMAREYRVKIGGVDLATALPGEGPTQTLLDRLIEESRQYRKEYSEWKSNGGSEANEPKPGAFLERFDRLAGFNSETGKKIQLGKLAGVTPDSGVGTDAQYVVSLRKADGSLSTINRIKGNKQDVVEFLEGRVDPDNFQIQKRVWNNITKEYELKEIDQDALANDRDVGFVDPKDKDEEGFDGRSEIDRMRDGTPDTTEQINFFGYSNPGSTVTPKSFGIAQGSMARTVVNLAKKTLRLKKAVSVFTADGILNADQADKNSLFSDPEVAAYVQRVAQDLKDSPEGGGRYIQFNDAHIILVDETNMANDLETTLVVAHELGHALYREQITDTLRNPALYNRLWRDFEKARDAKDAPPVYKEKHGFEEWYADQTAQWAKKLYLKTDEKSGGLAGSHFKQVARKLLQFYKALSKEVKKRFGKESYSAEFDGYMDEVLSRSRVNTKFTADRSGARAASMQPKILVRKMAEAQEKQAPGMAKAIQRQAIKIINSKGFDPVYNFLFGADTRMRKYGSAKLADLFYGRAQDSKNQGRTPLGFVKSSALEGNAWVNKLEEMLDGELDSDEVKAAIDEAFSDAKTADLEGNALAVRQYFDRIYDEYILPSNTDIGRQKDYAPVVLKLSEIHTNPDKLVELIVQANPDENVAAVNQAVQRLVEFQQAIIDDKPIQIEGTDPTSQVEKALKLTRNVKREALKDAGYLEDSDVAMLRYIGHVTKRVEWNRNTKDSEGNSIFEEEMRKLSKGRQQEVTKIVHTYLGYTKEPLGPVWSTINSAGMVLQIFALLPFAVLGSLPELAGPVIASKEMGTVQRGMKEIVNTVRNRDEATRLARDLGLITSHSVANALMSQSELEWMNENARKLTEGFFRTIGLDTYTKFTREFGLNMGIAFIREHSDPKTAKAFSPRYLKELGITADEAQAWLKDKDFNSAEGQKVRVALQRFVESATLRPNAAERPLWASDPRWALFWQLKGFYYSYSKVILMGAKREAAGRLDGVSTGDASAYAGMAGAAGVLAMLAIATMPLAMVGMELREYAKFGAAFAIPGIDHTKKDYFRTDDMNYGEYLGAAFDRAYGTPLSIVGQAFQSMEWGRGPIGAAATIAGPTAEMVTRVFQDGMSTTFTNRILPTGIL